MFGFGIDSFSHKLHLYMECVVSEAKITRDIPPVESTRVPRQLGMCIRSTGATTLDGNTQMQKNYMGKIKSWKYLDQEYVSIFLTQKLEVVLFEKNPFKFTQKPTKTTDWCVLGGLVGIQRPNPSTVGG